MKPGGQRAKGIAFELLVADILRSTFPTVRRRAMQARGGREGADLENTSGFWIECGHGKRMDPVKKWNQAANDCISGTPENALGPIAVAITRRDRGPILATIHVSDLIRLLEGWNDGP